MRCSSLTLASFAAVFICGVLIGWEAKPPLSTVPVAKQTATEQYLTVTLHDVDRKIDKLRDDIKTREVGE